MTVSYTALRDSMNGRPILIGLISVAILATVGAYYLVPVPKYNGWIEDDINGALGVSLIGSETNGKSIAATSRPDSAGFTYTDVLVEIEPPAFREFLDDADLPGAWELFAGPNAPRIAADTLPWWRNGEPGLSQLGWGEIEGGYRRVVVSSSGTFVFLVVPERRWIRYRHYSRRAV